MKILIADDHAVVRQGYGSLLSMMLAPCEVVEADSAEQACIQVKALQPELVIMDVNFPDICGLEATRKILADNPTQKVLFFSMYDDLSMVRQALETGAQGYITKSSSPEVLIEAVKAVLQGQCYVEPALSLQLAERPEVENARDDRLSELTAREYEIFLLLAQGLSTKLIAEKLNISGKTVSNHGALLKNKLNVSSTVELVHLAIETKVINV